MNNLLLQFLPLAMAALAPVMIMAVIMILSAEGGFGKAISYILGRILAYALWGVLLLGVNDNLPNTGGGQASTASLVIKSILGLLLLVVAIRTYVGEDDPDAPPPKWMLALDKASPTALFGIAVLLSVIQLRFVLLMMAGINSIVMASLPASQVVISLVILILAVIWPQLLPILIYLFMGQKAQVTLNSMNRWLTRNQRMVNVVVLGLFGIILTADGLSGLL
jgi:hypothetical protein